MKKVINGLLYDTDKSELIYEEQDTHRQLYRTKKGRWFKVYQNGVITPITEDEAKAYLGEHDAELFVEIFGEDAIEEA